MYKKLKSFLFPFFLICGTIYSTHASEGKTIYFFDATSLNSEWHTPQKANEIWDTMHALTALQGLVNRQHPQLYINYCSEWGIQTDQFWLNWYRTEDLWLKDASIVQLQTLDEVFDQFRDIPQGLIVYDPKINSTANVASTAAGVLNSIPVRWSENPNSLFHHLQNRYQYPVKEWLVHPDGTSKFTGKGTLPDYNLPSTGSLKTDPYRWAIERYLKTALCNPLYIGYYIDAFWTELSSKAGADMHTLSNHDYFISKRAFFFDLSPWGDETPNDDPSQPLGTDLKIFREIMWQHYLQSGGLIIKVGGFIPWPFKYTDSPQVGGKHGAVSTEWEFGKVISQYNAYMEADAAGLSAMANASFHTHYPLKKFYPQPNPKPSLHQWKENGFLQKDGSVKPGLYLGHYVGDYDSPAWLYKSIPHVFTDKTRGQIPLGWAFNPNLVDRAPMALVYAYQNASSMDFFITGDSGAGYLNPRSLTQRAEVDAPSGLPSWIEHCQNYLSRWDMSIVGFVLDGAGYKSTEYEFRGYRHFAQDGCGTHFEDSAKMISGVPTCNEWDLNENPEIAARDIANIASNYQDKPGFVWCRSILKSPSWYAKVSEILKNTYPESPVTVVDPYTFFGLIRQTSYNSGMKNEDQSSKTP